MPHLGPWEIIAIVAVVLIIFGVGKLPQALGSLGKGVRNFKKGMSGEDVDTDTSKSEKGKDKADEKDSGGEK